MRMVQVHISLNVPDDVTDDMLLGWLPSIAAQVDEPVYDADASGNNKEFESSDVMLDLYVDGRNLDCVQSNTTERTGASNANE